MACYVVGVVWMSQWLAIVGVIYDVTMACYVVGVVYDVTMACYVVGVVWMSQWQ